MNNKRLIEYLVAGLIIASLAVTLLLSTKSHPKADEGDSCSAGGNESVFNQRVTPVYAAGQDSECATIDVTIDYQDKNIDHANPEPKIGVGLAQNQERFSPRSCSSDVFDYQEKQRAAGGKLNFKVPLPPLGNDPSEAPKKSYYCVWGGPYYAELVPKENSRTIFRGDYKCETNPAMVTILPEPRKGQVVSAKLTYTCAQGGASTPGPVRE